MMIARVNSYDGFCPFIQPGDVLALSSVVDTNTGDAWHELEAHERSRTTGYNNIVRGPDGLVRVQKHTPQGWECVREPDLGPEQLAATRRAIGERAARIAEAWGAIDTLKALQTDRRTRNRPAGWGLAPSVRPLPESTYQDDLRVQATVRAEWDAAAALVKDVLGYSVDDLQGYGYIR